MNSAQLKKGWVQLITYTSILLLMENDRLKYIDVLHFARSLRKNQTKAESYVWERIRKRKLLGYRFNRQFIIHHSTVLSEKSYFIVDFYCHEKKLVIEIDGQIHRETVVYDNMRDSILKEMEFRVLRFRNDQVLFEWKNVQSQIERALLTE